VLSLLFVVPIAQIKDPLTLPYGVLAELDSERGTLTILESATVQR
jgi:hypothetical protein